MAVKKRRRRHNHFLRHNKHDDISTLSQSLAPLEEIDPQAAKLQPWKQEDDTIIVDTGSLKLPQNLLERKEEEKRIFGLEPVVLAILILLLGFIAFIAYQIYHMPAPTN